jgi:hypothetical protein
VGGFWVFLFWPWDLHVAFGTCMGHGQGGLAELRSLAEKVLNTESAALPFSEKTTKK